MATLHYPSHLWYQQSDEWLLVEGDQGTIGVSDYAQDALNDIVFVELPEVGDVLKKGAVFGTVESVKAAADLKMPIDGEVVAVNTELEATPETINAQPYTGGWIIKIKVTGAVEALMNADAYRAFCESR
ncbi:MAG: glycine cleavage system protein GcvH [Phototrophicaceae bacterium]